MTAILVISLAIVLVGIRASWSSPCGESLVTTVHPLAETARGRNWMPTAMWFVVATIGTAALGGLIISTMGSVIPLDTDLAFTLGALFLIVAGGLDLVVGPPPTTTRQLNENWLTNYRGWIIGLGYGGQLGSGFATVVPSWTGYALVPVLLLAGEPISGAVLGAAFGLGRVLAVAPGALIQDRADLVRISDRWVRAEPSIAVATSVGVVGLGAGSMLIGSDGTLTALIAMALIVGAAAITLGLRRDRSPVSS